MAANEPAGSLADMRFEDFDLTLTERDLDEFLSLMEAHNGAAAGPHTPTAAGLHQLTALDLPAALQLQPHGASPCRSPSEGSGSVGASGGSGTTGNNNGAGSQPHAAQPGATSQARRQLLRPHLAASDGSLTSAASPGNSAGAPLQQLQQELEAQFQLDQQQAALGSVPASLAQQQQQQAMDIIKQEGPQAGSSANALVAPQLAGASSPLQLQQLVAASAPCALGSPHAGACTMAAQPMQWHPSTAVNMAAAAAAAAQQPSSSASQPLPQLVFLAPSGQQQQAMLAAVAQQQQQQSLMAQLSLMQSGGLNGLIAMDGGAGSSRQAGGGTSSSGGPHSPGMAPKTAISHSTVEKQRRDRLNSLIDELGGIVPPADPKYGADANSVRRPKHVVLADTINLLKAMHSKLQLEEAEICTLKQQTAAVAALAAAQQQQQLGGGGNNGGGVIDPADAMMMAAGADAAAGGVGGLGSPRGVNGQAAGGGQAAPQGLDPPLPAVPEGGASASGVVVEQGTGCLYVKVNCRDRRGLLGDVVAALKSFPLVIVTAAITTTRDGCVHDVFEVRTEDDSVSAEDIQCAVHTALFAPDKARSKRLRANSMTVPT